MCSFYWQTQTNTVTTTVASVITMTSNAQATSTSNSFIAPTPSSFQIVASGGSYNGESVTWSSTGPPILNFSDPSE